jgi:tetratricopeptide (TPR) repeat protein
VFFFCLTILPFANTGILFQNVTGIVGERLVYQASAGFCMILALGLYYAGEFIYRKYMAGPDKKAYQVVLGLVMAVAVPYLVLTINRNTQWKNKLTLYEHDIRYLGQSARANFIMAGAIMNRLNDKTLVMDNNQALLQSRTYLYQAVTVYPKYDAAWLGLANLYRNYFTMNDSAIVFLGKIDKQHPKYFSRSQEMLGDIYYQDSANAQKAINYYYRGIYSNPGNRPLYNKMSKVMYKENMYDSLKNFGEIGIKNNWEEGFFNKAEWFLFQDDTVTAIQHYQKAVDMGYRDPMLLENLAYYYKTKGQFIELNRLPKE